MKLLKGKGMELGEFAVNTKPRLFVTGVPTVGCQQPSSKVAGSQVAMHIVHNAKGCRGVPAVQSHSQGFQIQISWLSPKFP